MKISDLKYFVESLVTSEMKNISNVELRDKREILEIMVKKVYDHYSWYVPSEMLEKTLPTIKRVVNSFCK